MIRDHSSSQNSELRLKKSTNNKNQVFGSKQERFPPIDKISNEKPGPGSYIDPLALSREL